MIRKTYSANAVEWTTFIKVGNTSKSITFSGGSYSGGVTRARFTTTDESLQSAIEGDSRYGKSIFLEKIIERKATEKKEDVEINEDDVKEYNLVTRIQDAKNILNKDFNIPLTDLTNKKTIKEAAIKVKVAFPNL